MVIKPKNKPNTIVERGEMVRGADGQIVKMTNSVPLHEDTELVNYGDVPSGKGGMAVNANAVITNSYAHARNGNRKVDIRDRILSMSSDEMKEFAQQELGLKVNSSSEKNLSLSEVASVLMETRDREMIKANKQDLFRLKNRDVVGPFSKNSMILSDLFRAQIPSENDIFESVLQEQEMRKGENPELFKDKKVSQYGGYEGFVWKVDSNGKGYLDIKPDQKGFKTKKNAAMIAQYGNFEPSKNVKMLLSKYGKKC